MEFVHAVAGDKKLQGHLGLAVESDCGVSGCGCLASVRLLSSAAPSKGL